MADNNRNTLSTDKTSDPSTKADPANVFGILEGYSPRSLTDELKKRATDLNTKQQ